MSCRRKQKKRSDSIVKLSELICIQLSFILSVTFIRLKASLVISICTELFGMIAGV